ncbi:MAG: cell division protein FtsZ [SAR202 cluster bacterium]|nr:cell division protein FtsZ [SAR202 cluster bacterium]
MATTATRRSGSQTYSDAPASIAVVGVGGGGVNAIRRMLAARKVPGVKYIVANTDVKSLASVEGALNIHLGERITHGLGAGGNPEVGATAADSGRAALKKALGKSDLVFLAAGMGGGTGTGAAPVVAEVAKQAGALVVGVVTTPFSFEGARRLDTAHAGMARLREHVDNLIVIHNDRLLQLFKKDVSMEEALKMADEAVMLGVLSVAELVNVPGEINVDLADVKAIMKQPGQALMAIGEGKGQGAVIEAARRAVSNPLLDVSIDGAKGVLFNVNGGPTMTLGEVNATGEFISSKVDHTAMIFFGMVNDKSMEDHARITIIATGIPQKSKVAPPAGNLGAPTIDLGAPSNHR